MIPTLKKWGRKNGMSEGKNDDGWGNGTRVETGEPADDTDP
jgi:hypothetical protein